MYKPNEDRILKSEVHIIINGKGGHSSVPFKSNNPILAASNIIQMVSERTWFSFSSFDNVWVKPVYFDSGNRANIIPEIAKIRLEAEASNEEQINTIKSIINEIIKSIEVSHKVTILCDWQ